MIDGISFAEAMAKSGVQSVAVIDDVFDLPRIDADSGAGLLDFLEKDGLPVLEELSIDANLVKEAKTAIERSVYDSEAVQTVLQSLYDQFINSLDQRFDPAGLFGVQRAALSKVRPLLQLLRECSNLTVHYGGSENLEQHKETHLLFVDFFLDSNFGVDDNVDSPQATSARSASLERVQELIAAQKGQSPSIVLMSSKDVGERAERFRSDIAEGRVFKSRFAFLKKDDISLQEDGSVAIERVAAAKLLDVLQSYEFGRALQKGLESWLDCAQGAVENLRAEIDQMDLKDFVYLVRFRLSQEGQGLLNYLEWFFGECLVDAIGKAVDAAAASAPEIVALNESADRVEGAFGGATRKVAELFHRVRIETRRPGHVQHFRMGDLYKVASDKVVATITPDCDLITRPDGKRRATKLLTVGGTIKRLDAPEGSVSEFFMMNNEPFNITWNCKLVDAKDFAVWPSPGASNDAGEFLGTLRPLYAQALQREVLHDLGRVGVAVAPAIGTRTRVKGSYREKGGKELELDLSKAGPAQSVVVFGRGGSDKPKVLFDRELVWAFLDAIRTIEDTKVKDGRLLAELKKPEAYAKLRKMYLDGVDLENTVGFGILVTAKPKAHSDAWCWLKVSSTPEIELG